MSILKIHIFLNLHSNDSYIIESAYNKSIITLEDIFFLLDRNKNIQKEEISQIRYFNSKYEGWELLKPYKILTNVNKFMVILEENTFYRLFKNEVMDMINEIFLKIERFPLDIKLNNKNDDKLLLSDEDKDNLNLKKYNTDNNDHFLYSKNTSSIDLTYFYSNPHSLDINKNSFFEYSKEIQCIISKVEARGININVQPLSLERMEDSIRKGSKILHISVNGSYYKKPSILIRKSNSDENKMSTSIKIDDIIEMKTPTSTNHKRKLDLKENNIDKVYNNRQLDQMIEIESSIMKRIIESESYKENNKTLIKETNIEFYLNFEDGYGNLNRINSNELNVLFEKIYHLDEKDYENENINLELIIINTPFVEETREIFRKVNLPNHISLFYIYSDFSIKDEVSYKFIEIFYKQIFNNHSIYNSYNTSVSFIDNYYEENKVNICCCYHIHEKSCQWIENLYINSSKNENIDPHLVHLTTCKCRISLGKENIHYYQCESFKLFEYNNKSKRNQSDIKQKKYLCCCGTNISITNHNFLRFIADFGCRHEKILFSYPSSMILSNIHNDNYFERLGYEVDMKFCFIGRIHLLEKLIYEMFISNNKKRYINIYGEEGMSQRDFALGSMRYLYERELISYIKEVNSNGFVDFLTSLLLLLNTIDSDYIINENQDDIEAKIYSLIDQNIVFVINITNDENDETIREVLNEIIRNTFSIKIITISYNSPFILMKFPLLEYIIKLEKLDSYSSAVLLRYLSYNYLPDDIKNNIDKLKEDSLVIENDGRPEYIKNLSDMFYLNGNDDIDILSLFQEYKMKNFKISSKLIDILSAYEEDEKKIILKILFLLNINTSGLFLTDFFLIFDNDLNIQKIIGPLLEVLSEQNLLIYKKKFNKSDIIYVINPDLINKVDYLTFDDKKLCIERCYVLYAAKCRHFLSSLFSDCSYDEFTAAQNYGIWMSFSDNPEIYSIYKQKVIEKDIKVFTLIYEPGLRNALRSSNYEVFFNKDVISKDLIEAIEQITICIPSLFYYMNRTNEECIRVIYKSYQIADTLDIELSKARLNIFGIYMTPRLMELNDHVESLLSEACKIFEKYNNKEGIIELYFSKYIFQLGIQEREKSNETQNIIIDLFELIDKLNNIDKESFIKTKGRIYLCIITEYNKNYPRNDEIPVYIKESILIFTKLKSEYYIILSLIEKIKYYQENLIFDECKTVFTEIKMRIKKKPNMINVINNMESKFKEIVDIYMNDYIIYLISSPLVLLQADKSQQEISTSESPFVNKKIDYFYNPTSIMNIIINTKPIVKYDSRINKQLSDLLNETKAKSIIFKYDILNKFTLEDSLIKGGRLLILESNIYDKKSNSIYIEGQLGIGEKIDKKEIEKIFCSIKKLFDYVILLFPHSDKIGNMFIRKGVKNVIYFNFSKENLSNMYNQLELNIQGLYQSFIVNFIKSHFIEKLNLEESFDKSKIEFESYFEKHTEILLDENEGPILIINKKNESKDMFIEYTRKEVENESNLNNEFEIKNITESKMTPIIKYPFNISSSNQETYNFIRKYMIGRKKDIFMCLQILIHGYNLNIYGEKGIGKTYLSKKIGEYAIKRGYFSDGIFYFNLNKYQSDDKLSVFQNELCQSLSPLITNNSKNANQVDFTKRILIILDNADIFTEIEIFRIKFFNTLFTLTPDGNIHYISYIINTQNQILEESFIMSNYFELKRLKPMESVALLLVIANRKFDIKDIDIDEEMKTQNKRKMSEFSCKNKKGYYKLLSESVKLKKCEGNPELLIKLGTALTVLSSFHEVDLNQDILFSRRNKKRTFTIFGMNNKLNNISRKIKQTIQNEQAFNILTMNNLSANNKINPSQKIFDGHGKENKFDKEKFTNNNYSFTNKDIELNIKSNIFRQSRLMTLGQNMDKNKEKIQNIIPNNNNNSNNNISKNHVNSYNNNLSNNEISSKNLNFLYSNTSLLGISPVAGYFPSPIGNMNEFNYGFFKQTGKNKTENFLSDVNGIKSMTSKLSHSNLYDIIYDKEKSFYSTSSLNNLTSSKLGSSNTIREDIEKEKYNSNDFKNKFKKEILKNNRLHTRIKKIKNRHFNNRKFK